MKNNWLIPFQGRNYSMHFQQNFLWKNKSIYIMDNHRAALWCWFQHMQKGERYNIFHMDRHYDTLNSNLDTWVSYLPDLWKIKLDKYLNAKYKGEGAESLLFRYDNYLSIFLDAFNDIVDKACFATHKDGDKPNFKGFSEYPIWNVSDNLDYWLSEEKSKWIVNLDLDYFFCDYEDSQQLMFSMDYISAVFNKIAAKYKDGSISVITVALSPEWSGGWKEAEKLCTEFCKIMKIDFSLANQP